MSVGSHIHIALATLVCAAVAVPATLAEPKNDWPFTRQVAAQPQRTLEAATASSDPAGEPKNQPPFTRVVTQVGVTAPAASADVAGEPKNDVPFVRATARTPVVAPASDGFDWSDAGIGAGAALGLAALGLGVLALRVGPARRPRMTGA